MAGDWNSDWNGLSYSDYHDARATSWDADTRASADAYDAWRGDWNGLSLSEYRDAEAGGWNGSSPTSGLSGWNT